MQQTQIFRIGKWQFFIYFSRIIVISDDFSKFYWAFNACFTLKMKKKACSSKTQQPRYLTTSLSSTKNLIEKMQIIMNITCTHLSSIWYTIFISNNSCWKKLKIRYIVVFNMVSDKQTSDIYKSIWSSSR